MMSRFATSPSSSLSVDASGSFRRFEKQAAAKIRDSLHATLINEEHRASSSYHQVFACDITLCTLHAYTATRYMHTVCPPDFIPNSHVPLSHYTYRRIHHRQQPASPITTSHPPRLACTSPVPVPRWMNITQGRATPNRPRCGCDAEINHGAKIMQLFRQGCEGFILDLFAFYPAPCYAREEEQAFLRRCR
jgi:hypothetical protein